jgi:hypothetical protein
MREIRDRLRKSEGDEINRFVGDMTRRREKTVKGESTYEKRRRESSNSTEMVYQADLHSVLRMFQEALDEELGDFRKFGANGLETNFDFYFACLDRVDILITEKNSTVTMNDTLAILNRLSYFRPKELERSGKIGAAMGEFSKKENVDDLLSARHRELLSDTAKFTSVPTQVFKFVTKNLSGNILAGLR